MMQLFPSSWLVEIVVCIGLLCICILHHLLELIHTLTVSVLQQILVQGSPLPDTNVEADIMGFREVAHSQIA